MACYLRIAGFFVCACGEWGVGPKVIKIVNARDFSLKNQKTYRIAPNGCIAGGANGIPNGTFCGRVRREAGRAVLS
ncbi:hypothetical protein [Thioalkalivibrio sp. ALJT]|uniref:hypothetical protein n=1 Tax=Thioalkalivibrio sp. ALJT TaxID=1158146 RepID=UPI0012DE7477|nr:hypothetical protein [Thioalkalivibrio sp. ALJT]